MFLLPLAVLLCPGASADYYDGQQYFNVEDRRRADCYLPKLGYNYLGERELDAGNRSCSRWIEFFEAQTNKTPADKIHPGQVALHSRCRSLSLPKGNATQQGSKGPWCYVAVSLNSYQASACFHKCRGNATEEDNEPNVNVSGRTLGLNYNRGTIDRIELFFDKYHWGPEKYYHEKPSDEALSAEYYRIKKQIFFACIVTVVVIVLYMGTCYCLRRKAEQSRRRRDHVIREIYQEEHGKIPKVITRPAPN